MAKVRAATSSDVATALFFAKPTIAGLAAAVEVAAPAAAAPAHSIPPARFSAVALAAGVPCGPDQLRALQAGNPRATAPEAHLAEAVRLRPYLNSYYTYWDRFSLALQLLPHSGLEAKTLSSSFS